MYQVSRACSQHIATHTPHTLFLFFSTLFHYLFMPSIRYVQLNFLFFFSVFLQFVATKKERKKDGGEIGNNLRNFIRIKVSLSILVGLESMVECAWALYYVHCIPPILVSIRNECCIRGNSNDALCRFYCI